MKIKNIVSAVLSLVLMLGTLSIALPVSAAAANCTWTGASDDFWNNAANWSNCNGTVPQDGDNLIFDITGLSSSKFLENDIPDLQVGTFTFTGNSIGSGSYFITGNAITLSGGFFNTACAPDSLDLDITLMADQSFNNTGCSPFIGGSGNLTIGSHNLTLTGSQGIDIESPIVGTGTVTINTTAGRVTFFDADSPDFSGPLNITSGRLIFNVAQPQALGTGDVTIVSNGILQESFNTPDSYTFSNNITIVGDGGGNNGAINLHDFSGGTSTLTFTGHVTLTGDAKIDLDNANAIFYSRSVGCGYTISKSGGSSGSGGSLTGNLIGSCTPLATSNYTWTQTSAPSKDWQGIAGSSDGKYLISAVWNGDIWTSSDYGVTWTDRTTAGIHNWVGVASSADGSHLAATVFGGDIWTSSDYGVTWTDRSSAGTRNWTSIVSSASGSRLVAVDSGNDLWTSSNYGVTWTDRSSAGSRNWADVTSSSDGSHLAAAVTNGDIYTSSDYGATWTDRSSAGSQDWYAMASSADGSHLAATVFGGDIWTSSDYGVTWTDRSSAGYSNWRGIAMSSDGKYIVALELNGDVWTSNDYGATWVDPPGAQAWYAVFMSASGARIAATASPGRIWTAYDPSLDLAASLSVLQAPNTGYGTPQGSLVVTLVLTGAIISLCTGLRILHRQRKINLT